MKKMIPIIIIILAILGAGAYFFFFKDKGALNDADIEAKIESQQDLQIYLNENTESNVSMVVVAPNEEALYVMNKEVDGERVFDKIGFISADGRKGVIIVGDNGLPDRVEFEGSVSTFSNYTDTTVDITVEKADGTKEVFEGSAIKPPVGTYESSVPDVSWLLATPAYAVIQSEPLRPVMELLDALECGAGLFSVLYTGGATSPYVYIKCGKLAISLATKYANINGCDEDIFECMEREVWKFVHEEGWFLRKGQKIKGKILNSITQEPISNGTIKAVRKSLLEKKDEVRGEWNSDATYDLFFRHGGTMDILTISDGYKDSGWRLLVSDTMMRAMDLSGNVTKLIGNPTGISETQKYYEVEYDLMIEPDAFIKGEVIDAEEGEPIKGVNLALWYGETEVTTDLTMEDGMFQMKPSIILEPEGPKIFSITASAKNYITATQDVTISYSVLPDSDEYDVGDWNNMIKMRPGIEVWQITGTDKPTGMICTWAVNSLDMVIGDNNQPEMMIFGGDCENPKGCPSGVKLIGRASAPGRVEFDVGMEYEGKIAGVLSSFEGNLGDDFGSGTWFKPIPEGIRSGELHHYQSCSGTWTAKKVIK